MNFVLKYFDEFGNYLYDFDEVITFSTSRKKNELGITEIKLSFSSYNYLDFQEDRRLEIHYIDEIDGELKLFDSTCWFLRAIDVDFSSGVGEITLTFEDSITLLSRRVVAWLGISAIEIDAENSYAPNYPSTIRQSYLDIIKLIFFYNYSDGVSRPTAANTKWNTWTPLTNFVGTPDSYPGISFWQSQVYDGNMENRKFDITMEPPDDTGLNPSDIPASKHDFISVLTAMKQVADAAALKNQNIWFDIIYTPATDNSSSSFHFKTFYNTRGIDRTEIGANNLVIGPYHGNVTNFRYSIDWSEKKTIIYAAGSGDNEARQVNSSIIDVVSNAYPFQPIEGFITPQSNDSLNALKIEADKELIRSQPKTIFSGKVVSRPGTKFATDFFYGDKLQFTFLDLNSRVEVSEYTIDVNVDGVSIDIPFGNENIKEQSA